MSSVIFLSPRPDLPAYDVPRFTSPHNIGTTFRPPPSHNPLVTNRRHDAVCSNPNCSLYMTNHWVAPQTYNCKACGFILNLDPLGWWKMAWICGEAKCNARNIAPSDYEQFEPKCYKTWCKGKLGKATKKVWRRKKADGSWEEWLVEEKV